MNAVLWFFFSSRRRHTRYWRDWSSDVCSSDLYANGSRFHSYRLGRFGGSSGRKQKETRGKRLHPPGLCLIRADAGGTGFVRSFAAAQRSEERRVGKECRSRWSPYH